MSGKTKFIWIFPEFLFHRQCLFGCKVTKIPMKAFIERPQNATGRESLNKSQIKKFGF